MAKKKANSRVYREIAERVVDNETDAGNLPAHQRDANITSVVRQWVTYNGRAILFGANSRLVLRLERSPLGRHRAAVMISENDWLCRILEDWDLDPDVVPELVESLNLGQSAEVTNLKGYPLRIWVDPKDGRQGVEPLSELPPAPPGFKKNYHRLAAVELKKHLGRSIDPGELEALAQSVVKQWKVFDGYACIFLDGDRLLMSTIREQADGSASITTSTRPGTIKGFLASKGFDPQEIPDVIASLNLGKEVAYHDGSGRRLLLKHNPKTHEVVVLDQVPSTPGSNQASLPFLCNRCGSDLSLIGKDEGKVCPFCGSPR